MNVLNLWDLSNERVYVKIKQPHIKNFFNYAISFAGSENKLAVLLGLNKVYNIYESKNGIRLVSLNLILKILNIIPLEKRQELKNIIENNVEELRYGYGKAKSIKNPKLPMLFSPILARIAGHLAGDGGIRLSKGNYPVYYTNQCKILVNQFKEDILHIFGDIDTYEYYKESDKTTMIRFPSIVGIILMKFFGPMVGKLKHVPDVIIDADNKFKSMFLKAIYDDEGCMSSSSNRISFEISNEQIAKTVKEMLKYFGIIPGKITKRKATEKWKNAYQFGIFGKDMLTFAKSINFSHPIKKCKLKRFLLNKSFIHKKGEQEFLIMNELKNGDMTIYDISKRLEIPISRNFRKQLFKLEKSNKITVKVIDRRIKTYGLNR